MPAPVIARYVDALVREMELYAATPAVNGRSPVFLYFGGGTPSLLTPALLRRLGEGLRRHYAWRRMEEVTFECAPRSVREEFLAAMKELGVTRVSMGVQSMDDGLLKLNGRVHLAEDVRRAFTRIRAAGFDHVNLDLMTGLIGESREQWLESVRAVAALGPESVTIYQTEMPHNTRLYQEFTSGSLPGELPSWDEKRRRLDAGMALLERSGYRIVSGYNAVRDPRKHRFLYQELGWSGADLLALGVASFGYVGGVHYQNAASLTAYEAAIEGGRFAFHRARRLTDRERAVREFILQLKLGAVDDGRFHARHGEHLDDAFGEPLQECDEEGWVLRDGNGVRLTRAGLLRVDRLLPRFYDAPHRGVRYT
jgi:oxygen-independent coproporphyrinogen-3 oxidase